ncbi:MAG: hypothetical protein ABJG88_05520 [Litorimonas sp.]
MKKALIGGGALLIVLGIAFLWLLSGASADNAPQDVKTIEISDGGER